MGQRHDLRKEGRRNHSVASRREMDSVENILPGNFVIINNDLDRASLQPPGHHCDVRGALLSRAKKPQIIPAGLQNNDLGSFGDGRIDASQHLGCRVEGYTGVCDLCLNAFFLEHPLQDRGIRRLLADQPAGCVALKKIEDHSCEMKRMFVYPEFHGKGIGYALAKAIIDEAKKIGYSSMKLDTSIRQIEAQNLYQGFGFKNIEAYYELPEMLRNWLVFMELKL